MTHVKLALLGVLFPVFFGGCASQTLPATDTHALDFVGTWHAVELDDASSFDDYVFGKDGTLTTLRSVKKGVTVLPMAGAGLIRSTQTSVACAFGSVWRSDDATTLIVDGACNDGQARDIELGFVPQSTSSAEVVVRAVEHQVTWMQPTTWLFDNCSLHGCD